MVVCLWNQLRAGRANLGGDDICKRGALWKMDDVLVVAALWTPGLRSEWTAFEFGTPLWNTHFNTFDIPMRSCMFTRSRLGRVVIGPASEVWVIVIPARCHVTTYHTVQPTTYGCDTLSSAASFWYIQNSMPK